jgi:tRNA threonylcarbamoyladenosine biosynthesis protein TsaE
VDPVEALSALLFESDSPERTHAAGVALGALLEPGHFLGLIGELGAGKTQFARGVAQGAGVPAREVSSPSFAIVYPYRGRIPLYHADLYRLADEDELYATGYFDLLNGDGALLVEWLDQVPQAAPPDRLVLTLSYVDENRRRIEAAAQGPRHEALLARWRQTLG